MILKKENNMWYQINSKLPHLNDKDYLDTIKFKLKSMFDDYEIDLSLIDYNSIEVFTNDNDALVKLRDLFCTQRVQECRFRQMRGKSNYTLDVDTKFE
jgi:hypothetical protein